MTTLATALMQIAARRRAHVLAIVACAAAAAAPSVFAAGAGNGTLYVATYKKTIAVLDEATEKVVDEIKLQTGIPLELILSQDRTRLLVVDGASERIEIVDLATRRSIQVVQLSAANRHVRIQGFRGFQADPLHRFLILLTRTATRKPDRWEIGPSTIIQYDLDKKAITRTLPWPEGEEREQIDILFSPDGRLMYFFSDDVLIYETENFTEVGRWELSRPVESGTGRLDFGDLDTVNDEPGFFTGLFGMEDPVQKRRLLAVGRVDLAKQAVDFYAVGPLERLRFAMAPDRKRGYGLLQEIGRYEFWRFDLVNRRLVERKPFKGRPRMDLKVSSNGKVIYIGVAGRTIDLYDADSFAYLRTITLDSDMRSDVIVVPPKAR